MKILLAADGSEFTRKAAKFLARQVAWYRERPEIHVLYVHPPLPYPNAVGRKTAEKYQREDSAKTLAASVKPLVKEGIPHQAHWVVGDVCESIAAFVKKNDIDLIVMGSHGRSGVSRLLVGSVTESVMRKASVPVLTLRLPVHPHRESIPL